MALDIDNKASAPVLDDWEIKRKKYTTFLRLLEEQKNCIFSSDITDDVEEFLKEYRKAGQMNYEVLSIEAELDDRTDFCTQIICRMTSLNSLQNEEFNDLYSNLIQYMEKQAFCYVDQCWERIMSYVGRSNNILLVFLDFDYYEKLISNGEIARFRQLAELQGLKVWLIGEHDPSGNGERKIERLKKQFKRIDKQIFNKHMNSVQEPYVYISYNWEDKSDVTANHLYDTLYPHFALRRDKINCNYGENIKEFMEAIREGQYIVVIISQEYLKSENCMFELAGIIKHPDYNNRLFPIVCDAKDSRVRDDNFYVELLEEWKKKLETKKQQVEKAKSVNVKGAAPLEEKLKTIEDVNDLLADIKVYIDYTNAPSYVDASNERFSKIIKSIKEQMKINQVV